jgi:hypothetical protein
MVNENNQQISPEWERLIKVASRVNYGHMTVVFQNGKPVRVEQVTKQIKLDVDTFCEDLKVITL